MNAQHLIDELTLNSIAHNMEYMIGTPSDLEEAATIALRLLRALNLDDDPANIAACIQRWKNIYPRAH